MARKQARKGSKGKRRAPRRKAIKKRSKPRVQKPVAITSAVIYNVPPLMNLYPATKRAQLRYNWSSASSTIDIPANAFAVQQISGNGIFDPDLTGGGTAPRGFDEAMVLYSSYRVLGSKVTVTYISTDDQSLIYCALYPMSNSLAIQGKNYPFLGATPSAIYATVGTASELLEMGKMMVGRAGFSGVGPNNVVLQRSAKTSSVLATKSIDRGELAGDVSNNPVAEWNWTILIGSGDNALKTDIGALVITVEYDVVFFERVALVPS